MEDKKTNPEQFNEDTELKSAIEFAINKSRSPELMGRYFELALIGVRQEAEFKKEWKKTLEVIFGDTSDLLLNL